MKWTSARDVLPHEAHDFTPWLANNLDLLADVLGLDQLELVATEWSVESFALDILAEGSDADGDVSVVIENQYGPTDHRHLGQLLTYAAHAAAAGRRVLAVWVVEEARAPHLAAVEFLNRVAAEGSAFGIVVLRVRFAPSPDGWHVHFEVDSAPNAFLAEASPSDTGPDSPTKVARRSFIEEITAHLDPIATGAGLRRSGKPNLKHGAVIYRFPSSLEISSFATVRVIASGDRTNVAIFLQKYPHPHENWAVAELLRRTYEPLVDGYGLNVDTWHGSGPRVKRDRVITQLPVGYQGGDAADVAAKAGHLMASWTRLFVEHPLHRVEDAVEEIARTTDPEWGDDTDLGG
jgi:hypothetical protein